MKEYIEREAIIPALEDYYEPINLDFPMTLELGQISEVLQNMPAADVAPVRHGRWTDVGSLSCRCSECGCKNNRETAYCPACGAHMDKEDEHEAD